MGSPGTTNRHTNRMMLAPKSTSIIWRSRRTTYLPKELLLLQARGLQRGPLEEVESDARPLVRVEHAVGGPVVGRGDGEVSTDGEPLDLLDRLLPVSVVLLRLGQLQQPVDL